jgi:quercetin dioxygenase-like cupin family protein
MKRFAIVTLVGLVSLGLVVAVIAQDDQALPKGFKTTPVIKGTQTASNMKLEYPRAGQAEIISVVGELEPGGRTARHQHPVPTFVYVLEGTITVQAEGGQPREYPAGKAFIEDVNHWHQAMNKGTAPAKILVVFMGEEGKPTTINAK